MYNFAGANPPGQETRGSQNPRKGIQETPGELAKLLDLVSNSIIVRDSEDRVMYWNEGAHQLYGYTSPEALGRNEFELLQTQFLQPLSR